MKLFKLYDTLYTSEITYTLYVYVCVSYSV